MNANLKKALLAGTAIVAMGTFVPAAYAANLDPDGTTAAPTALNPASDGLDTINDTDDGANNAGAIDLSTGSETVASIAVGDSDTNLSTNTIFLSGGNTFTVTGTTALTGDAGANDDTLTFNVGAEDSTAGTLTATSVVFTGNVTTTLQSIMAINYTDATNADTVTFAGATVTLGTTAGSGVTFSNASDILRFGGSATQTFIGDINGTAGGNGEGIIDINRTTIFSDTSSGAGAIGATQAINGITVADDMSATFRGAVTTDAAGDDFVLESADATLIFDVQTGTAGAFTVTGTVEGDTADGQGIVTVIDSDTSSAHAVTFASNIGAGNSLAAINVGQSAAAGGSAIFSGTVGATDINIGLADMIDMNATAVFADDVTATTIDVVGEATTGTTTVTFRDNVTGLLTITDAGTDAVAIFDTETGTAANLTMNSAILGGGASEGTVRVLDSNTANTGTVTFSGNIGGTAAATALERVEVGDFAGDTGGGLATFSGTVRAATIAIGDATMANMYAAATFNDDVTATTAIAIVGEATAGANSTGTFKGNVTSGGTTLTDGGNEATMTVDGTDAQTVTGAIIGGGAGQGNLIVGSTGSNSDVTFTGAIGGTALDLFQVVSGSTANILVAAGTTVKTTSAGVGVVGVDILGTLNLNSADGTIAVSDTVGDIDVGGSVAITGDNSVTFTGASDIFMDGATALDTALTAAATTTLTATAGDFVIGADSDTTLALGNQLIIATGDDILLSDASDKTVTINIRKTAAFNPDATTVVNATGNTGSFQVDTSGTAAAMRVGIDSTSEEFDDADSITIIDTNDLEDEAGVDTTWAALLASGDVEYVDSAFVHFVDASVTDDLMATISLNDANDVFEDGSTGTGAAQALLDIDSADTEDELEDARGNLMHASSDAAAQKIGESLAPDVAGGAVAGAQVFGGQLGGITSSRLAMLRGGSETGIAAGNRIEGAGWWAQGFGTTGTQDERDGVDGYDVDSLGVAIGADTSSLNENTSLGVALAYANTEVDSDAGFGMETDVDSFQIALYGDYDIDSRTYVAGQVGYIFGSNDTTRSNVGGTGNTANGDFDSSQVQVRAELGRDYMADQTKLTPKLLTDYTWYEADDYTETGAGTANLDVEQDSLSIFNIGAGVDASWLIKHNDGAFCEPALHAAARYDVVGDDVQTTNSFTGGGTAFQTEGADAQRVTLDLGADLTYHTTANWDLKAGYNFEAKEDFTSHSGLVKASYKF